MSSESAKQQDQFLDGLFQHPLMYLTREEYSAMVDFLDGYDSCCGHLDLRSGFYNWLVARIGRNPTSTWWAWLVLYLLPGYDVIEDGGSKVFPGREHEFMEGLQKLLSEYLADRRAETVSSDEVRPANQTQDQLLDWLFRYPMMYLTREEYFAVVDFLDGYDTCSGHLDLNGGFHEWLVARIGQGPDDTAWPWLALRLIPGYDAEQDDSLRVFPGREHEYTDGLQKLLDEYLSDRRAATVPLNEASSEDTV